jgi:methyltransferase (TIGR00027 family)
MKSISKTAFYCCGIRMQDAESPNPVCGDQFARLFMDEAALQLFQGFRAEKRANASNIARARIIDDYLRGELAANPGVLVVTIGAGFDSRPYRLKGGIWVELDEPQVIAYKDERLPVTNCPNSLKRIPIDFNVDSLQEKLVPLAGHESVIFVVEGVLIYLDPPACQHLAQVLRSVFPKHKLICDLMTRKFLNSYARSLRDRIAGVGASLTAADQPELLFRGCGYRVIQVTSIYRRTIELGLTNMPLAMLIFLRTLANGYSIYLFAA